MSPARNTTLQRGITDHPFRLPRVPAWLLVAITLFTSCTQNPNPPAQTATQTSTDSLIPTPTQKQTKGDSTYSNIRPSDYVGPEACAECHQENYASWQQHPHSRMNMLATEETVLGNFDRATLTYGNRKAVFRKQNGQFFIEYFSEEQLLRQFRISRVIGWRYEQNYVGFQTHGPEPANDPIYKNEIRLGFSYSVNRQQWFPQSYLEPTEYPGSEHKPDGSFRHDPFAPTTVAFNERCARCHNTYPYDLRLYKIFTPDGILSGFPPGPGLEEHVIKALAEQAGDQDYLTEEALPIDRLVTVGISCESCHFGGREHAKDAKEIRFVPTHPLLNKWTPDYKGARKKPEVVNAICRQCHHSGASAKDNWPDGSAAVNSMESIEQDRGGCVNEMRCTHCHNTHIVGPKAGSPDLKKHLNTCVECHQELQSAQAANAHSRHTAEQASCLDCHMPRIVQGFGLTNRTHRIASPTDPQILATGMPNACNLCHLDKSLGWTHNQLQKTWGKNVTMSRSLTKQFGTQLERPAGEAWLTHPVPLVRLVAADSYAHSKWGTEKLPDLIASLNETNAYNRYGFLQNIEKILGHKLSEEEYTITGTPQLRAKQVKGLLTKYTPQ
ncbi:MAG: hypothetical protein ACI8V2_005276 [Candidatus Latescibacterota bacterium]